MKRITILLPDNVLDEIMTAAKKSPVGFALTDRSAIIRYALSFFVRYHGEAKTDMEVMTEKILTAISISGGRPIKITEKAPALTPQEKKDAREAEARIAGENFCNDLDGRIDGEMCRYKKYEITAGGFVAENTVSVPVLALTQKSVDDQYYPNKTAWTEANLKEEAKKVL